MKPFHFILALLTVVIWGFNFAIIKIGLKDISPLVLCTLRFILVTFPLIFFIKKPNISFKMLIGFSLSMFAGQQVFLLLGMYYGVTAGLSSLLLSFQIFPTLLLAFIFLEQRPTIWQIMGSLIATIGLSIIAGNLGQEVSLIGLSLILAAALSWGIGNLFSQKIGRINTFSLIIWSSLITWPFLLVVTWILEGGQASFVKAYHQINWASLGALLYMAYLSTVFGYWTWNKLLSIYSAATVAPFSLMVPVVGIFCSSWMLNESMQPWKIVAAILIVGGLCINLLGPRLNKWLKQSNLPEAAKD